MFPWQKTFDFSIDETRTVALPKDLILENILDFDHVNYVHKRCYAYCSVVARQKGIALLEYGVYHIPGISWVSHYTMFHQYVPPDTVVHFSRAGSRGPWTKTTMHLSETQTPQGPVTVYRHLYERPLPLWMKPFTPILSILARRWTDILWEEDRRIVERRCAMRASGFKDSQVCAQWVFENGTGRYRLQRQGPPHA